MSPSPHKDWLLPGPVAWMVHNRVTPNLLMLVFLVGGLLMSLRIKQEVFPEFDLDRVTISVPYPGASPAEVEQGIVLAIEEAIEGVEDIEEVVSRASEGGELFENGLELRVRGSFGAGVLGGGRLLDRGGGGRVLGLRLSRLRERQGRHRGDEQGSTCDGDEGSFAGLAHAHGQQWAQQA